MKFYTGDEEAWHHTTMAIQMTADQLDTLVKRILGTAGGAAQPQGSALAEGPMVVCVLGIDKVKRPNVFQDWVK